MRIKKISVLLFSLSLLTTACGNAGSAPTLPTPAPENETALDASVPTDSSDKSDINLVTPQKDTVPSINKVPDAEESKVIINSDFVISTSDGEYNKNVESYVITKGGTYILSGNLPDGNIKINVGNDEKVNLELNGVSISCTFSAPIVAENADKIKIKAQNGTYNELKDLRDTRSDSDTVPKGALYTTCDLDLSGKGTLYVSSENYNGIHCKDSVSIKNVTLKISAADTALRGNDSVEIESGNIILIAKGGDGIKTKNTDISSKGNQRGNITLMGGNIEIYACCDGISASYNAEISDDCTLLIKTDKYSEYSTGKLSTNNEQYLVVSSSSYSAKYKYYAYFYNDDHSEGVWEEATYSCMLSTGRTRYYGLSYKMCKGYKNVCYFFFENGKECNLNEYVAASNPGLINTDKNAYVISSVNKTTKLLNGDYSSVSVSSGGNSQKSTYSSKGICANNEIKILGGTISIESNDDGLHANKDKDLDNGNKAKGIISIDGGVITLSASDDGIHADNEVIINAGTINITRSYEGIEGNLITINGGTNFVYASDDGINACNGSCTPLITINGGYTDVTTPSGDTDAIDSNGNITMTGGFVLVKGGNSQGMVAGSVDLDGKMTVSGGTIIALGGICETPTESVNGYVSKSTSFKSGAYEIKDGTGKLIASFSLDKSYTNGWWSSEAFTTGTSYTMYKDGSELVSWTQEEGTMNASASGGFGPGGFGGFGGFGGVPGGRR